MFDDETEILLPDFQKHFHHHTLNRLHHLHSFRAACRPRAFRTLFGHHSDHHRKASPGLAAPPNGLWDVVYPIVNHAKKKKTYHQWVV